MTIQAGVSPENSFKGDYVPIFNSNDLATQIKGREPTNGLTDLINNALESLGKGVGSGIDTSNANVNVAFDYTNLLVPAIVVIAGYLLLKYGKLYV